MRSHKRYAAILPAVVCVIQGPNETLTFVRQLSGPFAGSWLLPGGGIEVGERARDAAIRESYEETGLSLEEVSLLRVYEIMGCWHDGFPFHVLMSAFVAEGTHAIEPDFRGHNVGDVRQLHVNNAPLHSTDYRILTDAGFMDEPEGSINARLQTDGLRMTVLR